MNETSETNETGADSVDRGGRTGSASSGSDVAWWASVLSILAVLGGCMFVLSEINAKLDTYMGDRKSFREQIDLLGSQRSALAEEVAGLTSSTGTLSKVITDLKSAATEVAAAKDEGDSFSPTGVWEVDGVEVRLRECVREGDRVLCHLSLTNTKASAVDVSIRDGTKAGSSVNRATPARLVTLHNTESLSRPVTVTMFGNSPITGTIEFPDYNDKVLYSLELVAAVGTEPAGFRAFTAVFHNVPITKPDVF